MITSDGQPMGPLDYAAHLSLGALEEARRAWKRHHIDEAEAMEPTEREAVDDALEDTINNLAARLDGEPGRPRRFDTDSTIVTLKVYDYLEQQVHEAVLGSRLVKIMARGGWDEDWSEVGSGWMLPRSVDPHDPRAITSAIHARLRAQDTGGEV